MVAGPTYVRQDRTRLSRRLGDRKGGEDDLMIRHFKFVGLSLLMLSMLLSGCAHPARQPTSEQVSSSSAIRERAAQPSAVVSAPPAFATSSATPTTTAGTAATTPAATTPPATPLPTPTITITPKETITATISPQTAQSPSPSPTIQASTAPTAKAEAAAAVVQDKQAEVKIISVTSPVGRNKTATLKAKVAPQATASIRVTYKSGASKAQGLEDKQADSEGNVTWSWKVGGNTTLGTWPITVSSDGLSAHTEFIVE